MNEPMTLALLAAVAIALIALLFLLFQRSPVRRRPPRGIGAALLALVDGDRDAARDLLTEALRAGEESAEGVLVLGRLLREQGDAERSLSLHSTLLARPHLGPEQRLLAEMEACRDLLALGRHDEAEERLGRLEEHYVDPALTELRGMALLRQGRLEAAAECWNRSASVDRSEGVRPRAARMLAEIARTLLRDGSPEAAERWARRALDLDAKCAVAHLVVGEIAQQRGSEEAAFESWMQSLRCGGSDLVLGRLLELSLRQGRVEALLDALESLRAENPSDEALARAVLDLRLRRGDLEEFFALLESDEAPVEAGVEAWSGWIRHLLGRGSEADLRRLVTRLPDSFGASVWRCRECGAEDREPRRACTRCGSSNALVARGGLR